MSRSLLQPHYVLGLTLGVFALCALTVAVATPAWEANDEPDHVKNVETLVGGNLYRINVASGDESHQPPLYYALLAGWQDVVGMRKRAPNPIFGVRPLIYSHVTSADGMDQRQLSVLRLPGVLFALGTIVLAAMTARRLSSDVWTPAVAAGTVACVPKFTFLAGVVNNDNLVNLLGALVTFLGVLAITYVAVPRRAVRLGIAAALGLASGAIVLTKFSALPILVAALAAVLLLPQPSSRQRLLSLGVFAGVLAATSSWWLIRNQVLYGDPLALHASKTYLKVLFPALFAPEAPLHRAFVTIPRGVYRSFWYTSGWNQFEWHRRYYYAPFWVLAGIGFFAAAFAQVRDRRIQPAVLYLFGVTILGFSGIWILGFETTQTQARTGFSALAAIGCLIALGLERLRIPVALRFVLPVLGIVATVIAIRNDVLRFLV